MEKAAVTQTDKLCVLQLWSWACVVTACLCPWLTGANTGLIASNQKQILKLAGSNNNYNLLSAPGFVYDTSNPY